MYSVRNVLRQLPCGSLNIFKSFSSRSTDLSPLSGISVLDLTRIVAGPYCTMSLGDLGANVIKVEHPIGGDEARKWGPPFINGSDETCYFICLNRNKKSICINLKTEDGIFVFRDLAMKCDILVENFVPGKLDELGIGYESLKKIAPKLIYCSITGYGSEGPYAKKPGYDVIAAGYGGFMSVTGEEFGGPVKAGVAVTDIATGLYAYGSIMAALLQRQKSGHGQKIDCNLLSTQLASMINLGSNCLNAGAVPVRRGTAHESIVPYQAFATENGHLIVGTGSDKQFQALCKILDIEEISLDSKFSKNFMRIKNRKELVNVLENIFKTKSTESWIKLLEGSPFPYGPVNSLQQSFDDEHVKHIKIVEEMSHPVAGKIKMVGPPVKFSDGGNYIRSRPPLLGEHTEEILSEFLGYNEQKIRSLRNNGDVS